MSEAIPIINEIIITAMSPKNFSPIFGLYAKNQKDTGKMQQSHGSINDPTTVIASAKDSNITAIQNTHTDTATFTILPLKL